MKIKKKIGELGLKGLWDIEGLKFFIQEKSRYLLKMTTFIKEFYLSLHIL